MKSGLLSILAIASFFASRADAVPLTYDITVSGPWVTVGAPVLGLSGQPTLSGQVTVDNALAGLNAFIAFSFTTGAHTWTLADFVGPTASALFDMTGNLAQFSLANFAFGNVSMYLYSNNTMSIWSGRDYFFCNHCVSFKPGALPVPVSSTLALLSIGVAVLMRRTRRS